MNYQTLICSDIWDSIFKRLGEEDFACLEVHTWFRPLIIKHIERRFRDCFIPVDIYLNQSSIINSVYINFGVDHGLWDLNTDIRNARTRYLTWKLLSDCKCDDCHSSAYDENLFPGNTMVGLTSLYDNNIVRERVGDGVKAHMDPWNPNITWDEKQDLAATNDSGISIYNDGRFHNSDAGSLWMEEFRKEFATSLIDGTYEHGESRTEYDPNNKVGGRFSAMPNIGSGYDENGVKDGSPITFTVKYNGVVVHESWNPINGNFQNINLGNGFYQNRNPGNGPPRNLWINKPPKQIHLNLEDDESDILEINTMILSINRWADIKKELVHDEPLAVGRFKHDYVGQYINDDGCWGRMPNMASVPSDISIINQMDVIDMPNAANLDE